MEVMFTPFRLPTGNPRFMRLYCCLGPLKQGFRDGCRPIIGFDGCHLKGTYPGQLLTALGVDPNNGYWPIAWAVVEKEATEQWTWFLKLLSEDLEIENQYHYTFIFDQQKVMHYNYCRCLCNLIFVIKTNIYFFFLYYRDWIEH